MAMDNFNQMAARMRNQADQGDQVLQQQQSYNYGYMPQSRYQSPYQMQNNALAQIYAPWGGNPYNVLPSIVNNTNQAMYNHQAARLLNAPQVTQRMGLENQAQQIQNQSNNFQQLMSILPQLFGQFGGHILGGAAPGFKTDYGASATMGGGYSA